MTRTRRDVLAAGAALAALGGCATRAPDDSTPDEAPTDDSPTPRSSPASGGRQTATSRDPEPVDVGGAWAQLGADPGHSGSATTAGLPDGGRPYWTLRRIRSGPVAVADGRLYGYAELNEDPTRRGTVTATPDPDDGPAHIVNGPPYLVARDANEGRIEWTVPLPEGGAGWPAVVDGADVVDDAVVVVGVRGRVAAHHAGDGGMLWEYGFGEHPVGDPAVADGVVVVPLPGVVDGETGEYVHEPEVRAYDLADGSERWTVSMPKRGLGLAVEDGTVVVVSHDYDERATVLGLSVRAGEERWRTEVPGAFFDAPAVADRTAYVTSDDAGLRAFAVGDGRERWRRESLDRPSRVAVDAEQVYVGSAQSIFAFAASDGSERWSFADGETEGYATPAVAEGVVYAGERGLDGSLYALDVADGAVRWSFDFPDTVVEGDIMTAGLEAQPAVVDGAVYAYAADGLYAFGPS